MITPDADASGGLPPELLIGGVFIVIIVGYVALYLRGITAAERYANGFIIDHCPVCERGTLHVETRNERTIGIPQSRHIIRCDTCRSVLREITPSTYRYAVDPLENQAIYKRYNGEEITRRDLEDLASGSTPAQAQRNATAAKDSDV